MNVLRFLSLCLTAFLCFHITAAERIFRMTDYGIHPSKDPQTNVSPLVSAALQDIKEKLRKSERATLIFETGTYHFHPKGAAEREYYISNHDQDNPKRVGLCLEDVRNITVDGNGATFVFHGQMLPLALIRSQRCVLRNFTIDFQTPHIAQVEILANNGAEGITFKPSPEVNPQLGRDSLFYHSGEGWTYRPTWGIAFEEGTRRIVYNTGDITFNLKHVHRDNMGNIVAPMWKDGRLPAGTRVAMRTGHRPTPGIFLYENKDTRIDNVSVCYAEGMGLLAQLCENITMNRFRVPLSNLYPGRYFTTQADATHFSGCKGLIRSENGFYTGMMDDAINVHGTYLKVLRKIDNSTVEAHYMHNQSYGFKWGEAGDRVQFIRSRTMEIEGNENRIQKIEATDKPVDEGVRVFRITFKKPLPNGVKDTAQLFGIENLTYTPKVIFRNNVISNNRARGALFSTPCSVLVEGNTFDHVSGCALLLCGDCNGWYETGACRDVVIRNNRFLSVLTSQYQFTNAVISIYPEIPDLQNQKQYFHGGKKNAIRIENNLFNTFDIPLVYAKSVNGLLIKNNTVTTNNEYRPMHWNKEPYKLERVINAKIE